MSDSLPLLRHRLKIAGDLGAVVKTMKAMAAASITQFEQAASALEEYARAVELSLALYFRQHPSSGTAGTKGEGLIPPPAPRGTARRGALLVFGTDQGMVGQFNESLVEKVVGRLAEEPEPPLIWAVGERIQYRLENAGYVPARVFPAPNSTEAIAPLIASILEEIEGAWEGGAAGNVSFCRNRPLSRARYEFSWSCLLPLDEHWEARFRHLPWPSGNLPELVHETPGTLAAFVSQYLFVSLFRACAESAAAENGARLAAMQRAEKNIEERQHDLQQDFNRQRQKGIDEELFDLLAGYEALSKPGGRD